MQRRSDTAAHTATASAAVAAGNLRLESIPALREAGVRPTDVSPRNIMWDGVRVTIIDFADPEMTDYMYLFPT